MSFKIVGDDGCVVSASEIKEFFIQKRSKTEVVNELYTMLDNIIAARLNHEEDKLTQLIHEADIRIDEMIKNREI